MITNKSLKNSFFAFFALISLLSFGQTNSLEQKSAAFQSYNREAKKIGITTPNMFFLNKVDLSKYDELKAAGVDLIEIDKVGVTSNYKEASIFSDVIICGTVVKREYTEDAYYHSTIYIKIKEGLKNFISNGQEQTIQIKLRSGKTDDGYMHVTGEPQFFLGEEVMVYLDKSDGKKYERFMKAAKAIRPDFDAAYKKSFSSGPKGVNTIFYTVNSKYKLKQNMVFKEEQYVDNFDIVKKSILKISNLN